MKYFLEKRHLTQTEMTADITRHLQARQSVGKAIVITERPVVLLSSVRRQWVKMTQALQREISRTLDASLRVELSKQTETMQNLRFAAKHPQEDPGVDVYFIDREPVGVLPSECRTIYFCFTKVSAQALKDIDQGAVVVHYSD